MLTRLCSPTSTAPLWSSLTQTWITHHVRNFHPSTRSQTPSLSPLRPTPASSRYSSDAIPAAFTLPPSHPNCPRCAVEPTLPFTRGRQTWYQIRANYPLVGKDLGFFSQASHSSIVCKASISQLEPPLTGRFRHGQDPPVSSVTPGSTLPMPGPSTDSDPWTTANVMRPSLSCTRTPSNTKAQSSHRLEP